MSLGISIHLCNPHHNQCDKNTIHHLQISSCPFSFLLFFLMIKTPNMGSILFTKFVNVYCSINNYKHNVLQPI